MRTNWPSVTTYDSNEKFKHLRFAWGRLLCYIIPIPISVQLLSIIFEISGGVQSLSRVHLFMTMWTAACQASLSFTFSWSLLKLMSIESVMPSNHLILWHLLLFLPSVFPSIKVFSNESVFPIWWPKYWSFSFSISPSVDIQGWFPLGLTGLIFLLSKGFLRVFSNIIVWKYQFFSN